MSDTNTIQNRVAMQSPDEANHHIRQETEENVKFYSQHPELIPGRLQELENEWDIERTLETNAATLSLVGILLSVLADRRFLVLPALVAGFLLQHALQGWCPPLPLFRQQGIRTKEEILHERNLLKAIQGDYDDLCLNREASPEERARQALLAFKE